MLLHIFYYNRSGALPLSPLGLQQQDALSPYMLSDVLCPCDILRTACHGLELVGLLQNLLQGRTVFFWGDAYPVEDTAQGMGAGGLQKDVVPFLFKSSAEGTEVVHQRFTTGNHYVDRRTAGYGADYVLNVSEGKGGDIP